MVIIITFTGSDAGTNNKVGVDNCFYGSSAGLNNNFAGQNSFFGSSAGYNNVAGSGNVFLGNNAGYNETTSNNLYIANSNTSSPLIYGNFASSQLKLHGKVGIGGNATTAFGNIPTTLGGLPIIANYNLFVKGGILTEEIRVVATNSSGNWADYVFAKDYTLKPLSEVEKFINDNGHLPNVPSAAQVKEEGIALGDMAKIQQEKIEELTLYIIAQNKRIEALEAKMSTK